MNINQNYPTTVWVGEDRATEIGEACKLSKIKNPLFVTDKDLVSLPMTINIINKLKELFNELKIFYNF